MHGPTVSTCISHGLFCAREMIKTVDKKKILSSQASLTDHGKNSLKGSGCETNKTLSPFYLTQALVMQWEYTCLTQTVPHCVPRPHMHLTKQRQRRNCVLTMHIKRYLYTQQNVCFAALKNENMLDLQDSTVLVETVHATNRLIQGSPFS